MNSNYCVLSRETLLFPYACTVHAYACTINKMASGKAAGPSGIVAEMLKPLGEDGVAEVRDLIEDIISEGCIPIDWQESYTRAKEML